MTEEIDYEMARNKAEHLITTFSDKAEMAAVEVLIEAHSNQAANLIISTITGTPSQTGKRVEFWSYVVELIKAIEQSQSPKQ